MFVFGSVHVDASLKSGPVEMPAVLVMLKLAFSAARMTTWLLE